MVEYAYYIYEVSILCIMWQNSNAIFFVGHLQLQLSAVKTEINNVYCILFTNQSNN